VRAFRIRGERKAVLLVAFLLSGFFEVILSMVIEARPVKEEIGPLLVESQRRGSKSTDDEPSMAQITWMGLGDLARVTVDNAGLIGLYEAPEYWDGTYDGSIVAEMTNWNGYVAEYPRGSRQFYLFSSGLWIGAMYPVILGNDTTWVPRVATGAYSPDVTPMSPLYLSTQIIPPDQAGAGDLLFVPPGGMPAPHQRFWEYADTASLNPLRREYFGTDLFDLDPVGGDIVSEQDSWCVYGDWILEEEGHFLWPSFGYDTDGLGIRVEQRSYCWGSGPQMNYVFLSYKIKNMNEFPLDSLYVGYFMDADVGPGDLSEPDVGPNDDLIGFDISRNLGYTYDSNGAEPSWTTPAGYIGNVFLKTPGDVGLTAFSTWVRSDHGPEGIVDLEEQDPLKYAELVGDPDGSGYAFVDDPDPAVFEIFEEPRDVRSLMASGSYESLAPGEEVEVTVAMIAGYTLEELQEHADSVQALYDRGFLVWETFISGVQVSPRQVQPGEEVQVNAHVWDPDGILKVTASFVSPPLLDTLSLYDDGNHGDGAAGDHLYGNSWTTDVVGMAYLVGITVEDSLSNMRVFDSATYFTTLGPVIASGYQAAGEDTILSPGDLVHLQLSLENEGQTMVNEVRASVSVSIGGGSDLLFGDIQPGEMVKSRDSLTIAIPEDWIAEETIKLDLSITDSASVTSHWLDTLTIEITDDASPALHYPQCDPTSTSAGSSVAIRVKLVDGAGIELATADIESPVGNVIVDELPLYDDGTHADYLAGDGVFGNTWTSTAGEERFYNVNVFAEDSLDNQKSYVNLMEFTTKPFATTAEILVVDDDNYNRPYQGTPKFYETYYTDALEATGYSYDVWDVFCYGSPDTTVLDRYEVIIWETGETCGKLSYPEEYYNSEAITSAENFALQFYLLFKGGRLFLSGQGISDLEGQLLQSILGIQKFEFNTDIDTLIGVNGNPVGDGLSPIITGGSGAHNQFVPSALVHSYPWVYPVFEYSDYGAQGSAGIMSYRINYAAVTFAFGFEAIAQEETRNLIMDRVIKWLQNPTAYEERDEFPGDLPRSCSLSQNYPNPFNQVTEIKYTLPQDGWVRLEVYNILGQRVAMLADGQQQAGYKSVRWDANSLASGIYFYRLTAGEFTKTKKMVLIK